MYFHSNSIECSFKKSLSPATIKFITLRISNANITKSDLCVLHAGIILGIVVVVVVLLAYCVMGMNMYVAVGMYCSHTQKKSIRNST